MEAGGDRFGRLDRPDRVQRPGQGIRLLRPDRQHDGLVLPAGGDDAPVRGKQRGLRPGGNGRADRALHGEQDGRAHGEPEADPAAEAHRQAYGQTDRQAHRDGGENHPLHRQAHQGPPPSRRAVSPAEYAEAVVRLVNQERAKAGLNSLSVNQAAAAAANVRAGEIAGTFSHTRPDGSAFSTALDEQNVAYYAAGENIAYGQRSAEQVMESWMNSSGHRANILNAQYTAIGVGVHRSASGTLYWVQLFIG